ncbi:MAG TPA: hypothetical protein VN843_23000 [Anaerolineales bacterium]|nr:hypothetical protein [Anaerolineales bacterium]
MSYADFDDVIQTVKIFADYDRPWAVCGGWALDLFLNRATRSHKDVDFALLRKDQLSIQKYLSSRGWKLEKAVSGELIPWQMGEWLNLPVHTIWCKNPKASPDFVELLFNEVDEINFHFRRDTSITLPLEKMIVLSASGIPILAPEIVLLYKSKNVEASPYVGEFKKVSPYLSSEARDWILAALRKLYANHVWLEDMS